MERFFSVAQTVAPIFIAVLLGMIARRRQLLTPEGVQGMQQFVMKFGLPCVVFGSCYSADIGAESLTSMALVAPLMVGCTLWAFHARKKRYPYHNFPQLFAAQETGMLGIPLFMILFGADQAYRMGVLDLAQAVSAHPTIAILSADAGENPSPKQIVKKVLASPLLIMSLSGLLLNVTGAADLLDAVGIGGILTEATGFLGSPISAMMIFSVGYNFSLAKGNRRDIFRISGLHFALMAALCGIVQGVLCLIPDVDALTRWVIALYFALPGSYLAPSLGRSEDDDSMASGVCSILTVICLVIFSLMAALTA